MIKMNGIGKRIIVIGSPGSGKSTFSRKLAEIVELPLIHLDKEYWNDGWVETPKEEWIKKNEILISGNEWIIDGNYGSTLDMRIEKADTIICFQISRAKCIQGYLRRMISNTNKIRPDMAEGCYEKFDCEFIKYIWNFPVEWGRRNWQIVEKNKEKNIVVFKSRTEVNKFLINLAEKKLK